MRAEVRYFEWPENPRWAVKRRCEAAWRPC
jgi:hypothetical protein